MHRIDSTTAGPGNSWEEENQITGTPATEFTPDFQQDLQENLCRFVESQGITLEKNNYDQLTEAISAGYGRKRNLNFNPAFFQTQKWGGVSSIPTGVSTKIPSVGWTALHDNGSNITITPTTDGLMISGSSTSSDMTIQLRQSHSLLDDAVFGNDTFTIEGELKKFTASAKYKKVSGINFTIESFVGSLISSESIIKNEIGDSSVASIGKAYKHTQVNTKDLLTTPITNVGLDIHFASSGAFEINIKNCDLTEGFTIPDFQTYGNYIADKAFAEAQYGPFALSGIFKSLIPVQHSIGSGTAVKFNVIIPIPATVQSDDIVTITNESISVYDGYIAQTISDSDYTVNVFNGYAEIVGDITLSSSVGLGDFTANLSYEWSWSRA